jgi:hypothetical protein
MKNYTYSIFFFVLFLSFGNAKNNQKIPGRNSDTVAQDISGTITGIVEETMNSGGYTYLRVKNEGKDIWVAASTVPVSVGDKVTFKAELPMGNFKSATLKRTFNIIYFVNDLTIGPKINNMSPHSDSMQNRQQGIQKPINNQIAGLKQLEDGSTIADIHRDKESLNGKPVRIRGKVVKFSPGIMKTNWIHIQDGTSYNGLYDLTITTSSIVKVGDQIVVSGALTLNKDFGYGYKYEVLIENADIIVE